MKAEEQLIALFTWLGWQRSSDGENWWESPNGTSRHGLPPLTLDLMHEAWLKLDYHQRLKFLPQLRETCAVARNQQQRPPIYADDSYVANATKEQRLEALLKTINKWVE